MLARARMCARAHVPARARVLACMHVREFVFKYLRVCFHARGRGDSRREGGRVEIERERERKQEIKDEKEKDRD